MSTKIEASPQDAEPEPTAGEHPGVGEHRDSLIDTDDVPPEVAIRHLIFGGWTAQALRTMVSLDLADHLAHGSRTVDDLAHAAAVDARSLRRLLAVLAAVGLCERTNDSTVALTPLGSLLRSDTQGSLKDVASFITAPWMLRVWEALPDAVRTGASVFHDVHGIEVWEYLTANPEQGTVFDAAMTGSVEGRAAAILDTCDLSLVRTAVDVGGGQGRMLAALLAANPQMRGVLVDRPEALAAAGPLLTAAGVSDRCKLTAADFFKAVPAGGDVYVLALILHDWPDRDALEILRVCAAAMSPGARLIIVEQVLPPGGPRNVLPALMDVNMLIMLGGQERTGDEYEALLDASGFTDTVVTTTSGPWSVVEATKR
jgi:hypothetical protein